MAYSKSIPKPKKRKITLPKLKKKAQLVFNARIRERDKDLPCISCGKYTTNPHCGHYVALGSSSFLRYHPWNANLQCAGCNLFKRGNLIEYRIGLVKKIGEEGVEWLEDNRHALYKWTESELNEVIK